MAECIYAFWGPPANVDDLDRCAQLASVLQLIAPAFLLISVLVRFASSLFFFGSASKKSTRRRHSSLKAVDDDDDDLTDGFKHANGIITSKQQQQNADGSNSMQHSAFAYYKVADAVALLLIIVVAGLYVYELVTSILQWNGGELSTVGVVGNAVQTAATILAIFLVHQSRLLNSFLHTDESMRSRQILSRPNLFIYFLLFVCVQGFIVSNNALVLFESGQSISLFVAQCITLGCLILLLLIYGLTPRALYSPSSSQPQPICPLPTCCPLALLTFAWITPMMYKGWRTTLKIGDLWQLQYTKTGDYLYAKGFRPAWLDELERLKHITARTDGKKPQQPSVMRVLFGTIKWEYIFGIFYLILALVFRFSTPMILKALLGSFEAGEKRQANFNSTFASAGAVAAETTARSSMFHQRIMLALLLFVCTTLQSLLESHTQFRAINFGFNFTKTIVLALYEKALTLSNDARRTATVGQLINLIMVDAQKFFQFGLFCYFLINAPITIIISVILIWRELGPAALAGIFVLVILIPLNGFISTRQRRYFAEQLKLKDERLRQMSEMVYGVRILKLYAWEAPFIQRLLKIRMREIQHLRTASLIQALASMLWSTSTFFVLLATFAAYVLSSPNNVLTAQKTFVALALFNLIREPLNMLSQMIQFSVQFRISLNRVSTVLLSSERDLDSPRRLPYAQNAPAVSIEHGNFAWSRIVDSPSGTTTTEKTRKIGENEPLMIDANGGTPVLQDINLNIPPGTLTAIVGHVGAGKSSLCAALLGQMDEIRPKDSNNTSVALRGTTAYVPQQAWIQNATLFDNIIFLRALDRQKYDRIVDACALRADLAVMIAGDNTEIGEKGLNLSGGQKQRVSLARAAYSDAQVFVLDDPLSAVDAHVGKHIFQNLIANKTGLLKRTTRIMATHNIHLLPFVDNIIVMDKGRIVATGTYGELIDAGGHFAEFLSSHVNTETAAAKTPTTDDAAAVAEQNDDEMSPPMTPEAILETFQQQRSASVISRRSSATRRASLAPSATGIADAAQQKQPLVIGQPGDAERLKRKAKLIEEEQAMIGRVAVSVYWTYAKYISLTLAVLTAVLAITHCALSVLSQVWLAVWSSDVGQNAGQSPAETASHNLFRLGIYAAIGSSDCVAILFQSSVLAFGALMASRNVHELVLDRVMHAPTSFYDTTPSGRVLNRFSRDIDMIDTTIPDSLLIVLNSFINIAGMICVVIYGSSPWFLLAAAPLAVMYIVVQRFAVATATQVRRLESVMRSPMVSHFGETIQGLHVISAMHMEHAFKLEFSRLNDQTTRPLYCFMCNNRWINVSLQFIGSLIVLAASMFAILQHGWSSSEDEDGTGRSIINNSSAVGLVISNALAVTGSLSALVRNMSMLENAIISVERLREYTEIEQEKDREPPTTNAAKRAISGSSTTTLMPITDNKSWPQTGVVEFDAYEARYRPNLDLVLRGITERFEDGQKVGIVGRTGAGKSSFALALFRMIQPAGGTIRVDGRDIHNNINLFELRSRLSIIPQDPTVFSGTLRFNLDPWAVATDDELWQALRHAHLHEHVSSLPAGLEFQVGSDGQNLSVGQRQLVCLARALLRRSKILVLDEATAAVDLETDELVQESIRTEFANSTVITIAHRINTIVGYDRVMVLSNGKVEEIGAPKDLLQRGEASEFYKLARESLKRKDD